MKKGIFFGVSFLILMIYSASWAQIGNLGWAKQTQETKKAKKTSPLSINVGFGYYVMPKESYFSSYPKIEKIKLARLNLGADYSVARVPVTTEMKLDARILFQMGISAIVNDLGDFDFEYLEPFPIQAGPSLGLDIALSQGNSICPFLDLIGGIAVIHKAGPIANDHVINPILSFGGGLSFKSVSFPMRTSLAYEHLVIYGIREEGGYLQPSKKVNSSINGVNLTIGFSM